MINLFDVVRLRGDHPEQNLKAGVTGTVVHVVHHPKQAYVVEFANQRGETQALVTVTGDEIEAIGGTRTGLAANS